MIKLCSASSLLLFLLLPGPAAQAAPPQRVVACVLDAPGSTGAARPVFRKLFRALERSLGWSRGRVSGLFTPRRGRCRRELRRRRTTLALVSPELFLAWKKRYRLRPLAVTRVGGSATTRYHVVVKKDGVRTLDELRGASFYTNHGVDRRYVARVMLGGKLGDRVKIRKTRRPLRALRAVHRGKARATIIDDQELAKVKLLSFADSLEVVHTSAPLPRPVLVAVGGRAGAAAVAVAEKLKTLCTGETRRLCETLRLDGFAPVDQDLLRRLAKAYRH